MSRFKKLVMLTSIGFALSLAGVGERTVVWEGPSGVVADMVLGALGPAPLMAQLVCAYCVYDPEGPKGPRRVFVSFVNCDNGGSESSGTLLGDPSGCRVCIGDALQAGGGPDDCMFDEWVDGECPEFECGPEGSQIDQALLASARGGWEAVEAFAERFPQNVEYDPGMAAFAVTSCLQESPIYVPSSPRAAMLIALQRLRRAD